MVKFVAILNITPDSFSDGGDYFKPAAALAAIHGFIAEGADVIDIGAESTRPGATPLSAEEEWWRLEPVLSVLPHGMIFSIDTRHGETAQRALACGVQWVNDVSGFSSPAMIEVVKDADCKLVVMHSLSVPADKDIVFPVGTDVVAELIAFAKERIAVLERAGIARGRIIFDPGIGFGKTAAQSLTILENVGVFKTLGVPLLIGHSRKSFLSADRDAATLAWSKKLALAGVDYLRVHDVKAHRGML